MATVRRVLPLCLLLLLAGCNGLLPGPDTTTADVPPAAEYPPGVVMNGVASPERLASAQSAVLSNTSYATVQTQTVLVDGHVVGVMNATRRAGPGGEVRLLTTRRRGEFYRSAFEEYAIWSNASTSFTRIVSDGNVSYSRSTLVPLRPTWGDRLYRSLRFDVNRTDDGYVLRSTGVRDVTDLSPRFTDLENVTATLHLDRQGVVRSYRLEFDARSSRGGLKRYHVVETFDLTRVGGVTVGRPDWVAEAISRTDTVNVTPRTTNAH